VRFCANSVDVFVSCGQDGSVRMFDLRSLEHSTIIYEPTGKDDRGEPLPIFIRICISSTNWRSRRRQRSFKSHVSTAERRQPAALAATGNIAS
jgi:hypothetical protein